MMPFDFSTPAPAEAPSHALWFPVRQVIRRERPQYRIVACVEADQPKVITGFLDQSTLSELGIPVDRPHFVGYLDGIPCYTCRFPDEAEVDLPERLGAFDLFVLLPQVSADLGRMAGRASHFMTWDRNHRYCGKCGAETELDASDRGMICLSCGHKAYPRISPAVIMAVVKDDQLLLARAHRHRSGFYSVLAGFSEPGETLEDTVEREVREEVGIEVKNIRYFGSQPWPLPDSLMIGFTCEFESGEIELEESEIAEAGWYRPGEFPGMTPPAEISIAGQLIDWFKQTHPVEPKSAEIS